MASLVVSEEVREVALKLKLQLNHGCNSAVAWYNLKIYCNTSLSEMCHKIIHWLLMWDTLEVTSGLHHCKHERGELDLGWQRQEWDVKSTGFGNQLSVG